MHPQTLSEPSAASLSVSSRGTGGLCEVDGCCVLGLVFLPLGSVQAAAH